MLLMHHVYNVHICIYIYIFIFIFIYQKYVRIKKCEIKYIYKFNMYNHMCLTAATLRFKCCIPMHGKSKLIHPIFLGSVWTKGAFVSSSPSVVEIVALGDLFGWSFDHTKKEHEFHKMCPLLELYMELSPSKWPYKWVTGVITPTSGAITLLKNSRGPSCI